MTGDTGWAGVGVVTDSSHAPGRSGRVPVASHGVPRGPAGPAPRLRPVVLLACPPGAARHLEQAWAGQALDLQSCADLAVALVRTGQLCPDMIIVGDCGGGPIGPVDFVRTVRLVDAAAMVVGLAPAERSDAVEAQLRSAGATTVVRHPLPAGVLLQLLQDSRWPDRSFQVKPLPVDLGRLRVDGTAARIWVDGVEGLLPTMEFLLLRYLAERHGQIVPREELATAAWGDSGAVPSNSLAVHVTRLRRRFPTTSGTAWIRSVRGSGYQLVVPSGVRYLPRTTGT